MSRDVERNACQSFFEWAADEEWRGEFYGTVSGGSLEGRHGILFVTNYTVGLFADSGFFEGTDGVGHGIRQVHDLQCYWPDGIWNEADDFNAMIQVTLLDGATLEVSLFAEEQWRQQEIIELYNHLWHLANVVYVRADLFQAWNKIEAAQEVENHSKVLKSVDKILAQQPYCVDALIAGAYAAEGADDLPRALDYMNRAIESGGLVDAAIGHREVARMLYWSDDYAGCKEHSTIAITNFDDKLSYGWRAEATAILGDASGAEADFEKALKASPDDALFLYFALRNSVRLKNRTKQKRRAKALIKLDTSPFVLAFAQIILADLDKRYEEVAKLSLECLDEFGENDLILTPMLEAAESSPPARQTVLRRLPGLVDGSLRESPYAHFCLGYLLILDGDPKASKAVLERCAQHVLPELRADIEKNLRPLTLLCEALGALEQHHLAEAVRLGEEASDCQGDLFPGLEYAVGWMQFARGKAMVLQERYEAGRGFLNEARSIDPKLWIWTEAEMNDLLMMGGATPSMAPGAVAPVIGEASDLYEVLTQLEQLVVGSPRLRGLADRARSLKSGFDDPPTVAVMGEYSVGKSTFINALLGRTFLPSGEGVTTGTITVLHYGAQERMRLNYFNGKMMEVDGIQTLDAAVRETGGSDDEIRQISHVDVFLNSEVLRHIQIVDTPGLNAPFKEHQALSEAYLEEADAILFLFNVEAADRSTESEFLKRVGEYQRKAVAIVNQIDQADPEEVEEVLDHVRATYRETFAAVHGVSGLQALRGAESNRTELVDRSRMPQLRRWLDRELLEKARDVKRDGSRDHACSLITAVQEEKSLFEDQFGARSKEVGGLEAELFAWIDDHLARLLDDALNRCRQRVRTLSRELAKGVVDNHSQAGHYDQATITNLGAHFRAQLIDGIKGRLDTLLGEYDRVMATWSTVAQDMQGGDWSEVFHRQALQMQLVSEGWRKDLVDYGEKMDAYVKGFIDARGIWTIAILDIPDEQRHDRKLMEVALSDGLEDVNSVLAQALSRWQRELRENIGAQLTKFQRDLRQEANSIREGVFNPILRLEGAL